MVDIKILDGADEFRMEITGRFAGSVVEEALCHWKAALYENSPRRITIDISQLDGYDHAGCKLLREMCLHGTNFSASTPASLAFLIEISGPAQTGPALVPKGPRSEQKNSSERITPFPVRRASAAGE